VYVTDDQKYAGTGKAAMQRLLGIVHMNPEVDPQKWDHKDEDIYGIGGVRTPEKFYKLYGINVKKKTAEEHLCQFVDKQGKMHHLFTPHLRKDGMGIDYSEIDFRFRDPEKPVGSSDSEDDDEAEGDSEEEGDDVGMDEGEDAEAEEAESDGGDAKVE
jgi:hypothetical protein